MDQYSNPGEKTLSHLLAVILTECDMSRNYCLKIMKGEEKAENILVETYSV